MNGEALPAGLRSIITTATRALITACAAPGETGPQRVARLTGYSQGVISRWQSDQHGDTIPTAAVFFLELTLQKPIFAATLAALTGHRVEAIGDGAAPGDLFGDVVRTTGSFARFALSASTALADRQVTPHEAKDCLGDGYRHVDDMQEALKRLADIAGGGR